jgi:hypothetical protein
MIEEDGFLRLPLELQGTVEDKSPKISAEEPLCIGSILMI